MLDFILNCNHASTKPYDFVSSGPVLGRFDRIHQIGPRTLKGPFLKLKVIKTRLRSTMSQSRLKLLTLMSVKTDIQETLDTDELVEKFSSAAPRRMNLPLIAFLSMINRHCRIDNFIFVSISIKTTQSLYIRPVR